MVPIFGTSTAEDKALEAGAIVAPIDNKNATADASDASQSTEGEPSLVLEDDEDEEASYLDSTYAGTTLIMNILLVILVLILFGLLITCLVFVRRCINNRCCDCFKKIVRKLESKLMFNSVLRAMLESYFLVCISTLFGLYNAKFSDSEYATTFGIGLLMLAYLILFPILQHKFLMKKFEKLGEETYHDKYGSIYMNVDHGRRHSLRFTLYFCIRRLTFALAIILLKGCLVAQILVADFAVLSMIIFYVSNMPMSDRFNNFI